MTTHIQKIQALGNRMATNLNTMGVSASFSDGGLTLADKILQIQHFTNGLLLYADKDIIQTGNTVNLCALLLEEGKPVSGERIFFKGINTNSIPITSSSSDIDIGETGWILTLTGGTVYIGSGDMYIGITKTSTGYNITNHGASVAETNLQGNYVCFDGTNLTLYSNIASLDLSSWENINSVDFTNVYYTSSLLGTIGGQVEIPESAITNNCGVATVSYVGKGAGLLNIQCFDSERILSSKTYSILDCTFLDKGLSTDYNDTGWVNSNIVSPLDRTDGTKIEQVDTSSGGFRYRTVSPATDICIEFDFKVVNASDSIFSFRNGSTLLKTVYASTVGAEANTWTHIKVTVKDGKYYLNDSASGTALSTWNRFTFQSYDGNSLKYKNFVIYPI